MAQVIYVDNANTITIGLDENEGIWVTRLIGNGNVRAFRELITDWIRIQANKLVGDDLERIKTRLGNATPVELAAVMVALKLHGRDDEKAGV